MKTLAIALIHSKSRSCYWKPVWRVYEKTGEFKNGNWRQKKLQDFDQQIDAIKFAKSISNRILLATESRWL